MRVAGGALLGLVLSVVVAGAAVPSTSGAFVARLPTTTSSFSTNSAFTCAEAVQQDRSSAILSYALDDPADQTVALDSISGTRNGTYVGGPKKSVARGICYRDTAGLPYVLSGLATRSAPAEYLLTPSVAVDGGFTLETWFSTSTSTASGRAAKSGFLFSSGGSDTTAPAPNAVAVYLTDDGRLVFSVAGGATTVATRTGTSYADDAWYHVAATYSAEGGAALYVNGHLMGTARPAAVLPRLEGAWRIGSAAPAGWPSAPRYGTFSGSLRFAAMYSTALPAGAVAQHAAAGSVPRLSDNAKPNYAG